MRLLARILVRISSFSSAHPIAVLAVFLGVAVAGFISLSAVRISTNLTAGVGAKDSVIRLTQQNYRLFGEQDALIIVLEFPEPPGQARVPLIAGLGERIKKIPGVKRVLYRYADPDDPDHTKAMFRRFLLGMNDEEREAMVGILSPEEVRNAFRRNRNRLFLTDSPYIQSRILRDPLELTRFVTGAMETRIGKISLADEYLLIGSPDSTLYLIHVTLAFPSADVRKSIQLVEQLEKIVPGTLSALMASIPGATERLRGVTWHLTGKVAFQSETQRLFDREILVILFSSFAMVFGFLIYVYRSFLAVHLLMLPIVVAVGANYVVIYLSYLEINPVVMGSSGILFGLGTDFGVHLWGRLREELDKGRPLHECLAAVMEKTGPPVVLGALTSMLAFLCLCLSDQPAMVQFGYICASGVFLALVANIFLFPSLATLVSSRSRMQLPRLRIRCKRSALFFTRYPRAICASLSVLLIATMLLSTRISYEKDLYKAFLASDLQSMAVADLISRRFASNFSQPTFLTFEVADEEQGISIQRELDSRLRELIRPGGIISTIDSISYLVAPRELQKKNEEMVHELAKSLPSVREALHEAVDGSDLSPRAAKSMTESLERISKIFTDIAVTRDRLESNDLGRAQRGWYQARVGEKTRFLTRIRYHHTVESSEELQKADKKLREAAAGLPVDVRISGPRQSLEAILEGLVSELLRLGSYAMLLVVVLFFVIFRRPLLVALGLLPMIGALCLTLGIMGALQIGIPFSIIAVAPLIFGLGIDNGIHVMMRTLNEPGGSVGSAMEKMAPLLVVTSVTTMLGFLSMVTSSHYSLAFLGWSMVIGMGGELVLTIVALPAFLLLLLQRRDVRLSGDTTYTRRS